MCWAGGQGTSAPILREKLIHYGEGVVLLSNNRIERYHPEIAKIRSMRGVKNPEREDQFFQVYNFMHNFFRKGRLKRILGWPGLKLSWEDRRGCFIWQGISETASSHRARVGK